MIDKITIDRIYNSAQIVDVVSDFVTLKKRGVNYVGLCPFHEDKTPSFYVSPAKNICKCFSCGEGGTSIQFIMKHEQVSYYDALRYLAGKYNIEIEERELTDEEKRTQGERESMMVVNSWAQNFFTSRLYEHEEGRTIGLSYLTERGFRDDIIRKFQLGYSLKKRDDLYTSAKKQGFNESYLLKTGIAYQRDDGKISDRFYGRVIFPVHTLSGKIVAFGGRILGKKDKVAKYVNSPESEVYHKSYELYGMYFAKQAIVKAEKCYLVEGYTDVISMHQAGVENVVASSGTSLTSGQIRLIHRFTENITLLYDGDPAGIKAAIRGIDMLLEEGMNVKVVLLPEGEDPDSFARSHNSFDFTLYMREHEVDFIRFKANLLLKEAGSDPVKRATLIKSIMESVAVIPDNIIRSAYIKECSHLLDEREQVLIDEVVKIRTQKMRSGAATRRRQEQQKAEDKTPGSEEENEAQTPDKETTSSPVNKNVSPFKKYESALLRYVIRYGERVLFHDTDANGEETPVKVAEYIKTELRNDDIEFYTPLYKAILEEATQQCVAENFVASRYFLSHSDLEISEIASEMVSSKYQLSKYFNTFEQVALKPVTETKEGRQAAENELKKKEREQLERWVVQDLFALKNAYVKSRIEDINKQIKEHKEDEKKALELLNERMKMDEIKRLLSIELGERIVTGFGK